MALYPPLPVPDELSEPYWDGLKTGKLLVQRCSRCQHYQFPPKPACRACGSADLPFTEVSGRGKIFSFTETVSGARHPYFQSISPYLVGMVQLDEHEGLIFPSNFPGARYEDLAIGEPVQVQFQEFAQGTVIPQFRLTNGGEG